MKYFLFVILIVLCVSGCTRRPILNIKNAPISRTVTGELKPLDTVGQAIINAAVKKGWTPVLKSPGLIDASILRRTHQARIEISYTQTSFSINYVDSVNLECNGKKIHGNYNHWITRLSAEIQKEISISAK